MAFKGLDDVGMTLLHLAQIEAFEARQMPGPASSRQIDV